MELLRVLAGPLVDDGDREVTFTTQFLANYPTHDSMVRLLSEAFGEPLDAHDTSKKWYLYRNVAHDTVTFRMIRRTD
jgi:hypothetical protein